jgi:hypothetical protein
MQTLDRQVGSHDLIERRIKEVIAQAKLLPPSGQQDLIMALSQRRRLPESQVALDVAYRKASVPDWDGYGAKPVSRAAYERATRFLSLLPSTIPPDIAGDPDGEILIEWRQGPLAVLTISIGPAEYLNYAGLYGRNKVHGTESFTDAIPRAIRDNLARIHSEAGS